ncbi:MULTISPECIES: cytochrome P450 [Roseobacteraceae]|uniref:cytochrome P450 n=1 Tax=Roseobacteraceae TaxID=2854170 RepID=UPI00125EFAEC|nr:MULTISPECIES: cytochrome P450 [Roseobacteraceae]KAB6717894.1 cytochrome P450 [Roseobacter sp. TSBP12]|tara:strand:+ start:1094 stop:2278 length:1185 start_codon:yes stop_codon:yes gene_type:complete
MKKLSCAPTDPGFVQNPYPFYDHLREAGRMVWWEDLGLPVIAGYDGVSMALRDARFGREAPSGFEPDIPVHLRPFYDIEDHSMLELEGDRHKRLRGLVLRAFTSRRIKGLVPDLEEITNDLIDHFPQDADFDLLPAFCKMVPVRIICRLLGVPEAMSEQLLGWSNAMVAVYTPGRTIEIERAAATAATEFAAFMRGYVDERRSSPADDLITSLIAAEEEGEKLSTDELITTCILLLNAGHEATVHSLGIAVKTLLEHHTPREMIMDGRIDGVIEEVIRFDPPLHLFQRWVYEDTTFLGQALKRGDKIGLLLGAAGRDDDAWDDPNVFDPTRPVKQNMAFGAGIHFCVGAPLARLELRVALPILFARCPNLRLLEVPRYAQTWHFHGLERLMVRT